MIVLFLLFSSVFCFPHPHLLEPQNGSSSIITIPHFSWESSNGCDPIAVSNICNGYAIKIFQSDSPQLIHKDVVPAVITRYVPAKELLPGQYYWQIATLDDKNNHGMWSSPSTFIIKHPLKVYHIKSGMNYSAIQAIFTDAIGSTPSSVIFDTAHYNLKPSAVTSADNKVFMQLTNVSDLIIDGKGSSVVFDSFISFLIADNCSRIQIKNFSFDFDPLPYTALKVKSFVNKSTAIMKLESGHPQLEILPWTHGKSGIAELMEETIPRVKRGAKLVIQFHNWKNLGNGSYLINLGSQILDNLNQLSTEYRDIKEGDVLVIDPRIAVGFRVIWSNQVVLFGVIVFACSNECFTSEHAEKLSILQCGIVLKTGRFLAANNGGHNHHSARIGQWIEGGQWENTGDDICHVSGLVMSVKEVYNETTILMQPSAPDIAAHARNGNLGLQIGDHLLFFNRSSGRILAENCKIIQINKELKNSNTLVVLDHSPGPIQTGSIGGNFDPHVTQVYNFNSSSGQFVFRRNTVRNGRRVGVLAKGHRALIEDNVFQGLGGGAVELWNAPYEGLCATQYVIRNNIVNDTNQLNRVAAPIWTQTFPNGGEFCHHDIGIYNNTFAVGPGSTFLIADTKHAHISSNNITRCISDPDPVFKNINTRDINFDIPSNIIHNLTKNWLCKK